LRNLLSIFRTTPHDLIYLNSFFDLRFTQQVLLARRLGWLDNRPVVLAPRGEFSEGALQIKRYRKMIFLRTWRAFGFHKIVTWQASSDLELADIHRQMFGGGPVVKAGPIVIAPDLSPPKAAGDANHPLLKRTSGSQLRVCFVSRISRMKNLDYALRVLSGVRVPLTFTIYGPLEDSEYWRECQALIAALPPNITAVYEGTLRHDEVKSAMEQHDVFFLPTRGENFGHVIHQALNAGLLVLISDRTPWRDLEQHCVGWALPLQIQQRFVEILEYLAGWAPSRLTEVSESARRYAIRTSEREETVEANRRLFRHALAR